MAVSWNMKVNADTLCVQGKTGAPFGQSKACTVKAAPVPCAAIAVFGALTTQKDGPLCNA
ncbi:MAG: hypothetical protein LBK62_10285 [Treponema sp.]|nr:hypothetical protein [Treponema sp.]